MATDIKWRLVICVFCTVLNPEMVLTSQEVMMKLTTGFSKVLEQCKTELNAGDHIMTDFYNFWREEYQLVNRDLGCMVMCMATKLDLIGEDLKIHHGNTQEFAKKHGADDALAKQLVTIIHECESSNQGVEDPCNKVLEISKCFKTKIHELKWAPSMEIILEEIMTAV